LAPARRGARPERFDGKLARSIEIEAARRRGEIDLQRARPQQREERAIDPRAAPEIRISRRGRQRGGIVRRE